MGFGGFKIATIVKVMDEFKVQPALAAFQFFLLELLSSDDTARITLRGNRCGLMSHFSTTLVVKAQVTLYW